MYLSLDVANLYAIRVEQSPLDEIIVYGQIKKKWRMIGNIIQTSQCFIYLYTINEKAYKSQGN